MFILSQKYVVDKPVVKGEYIRYTPPSLNLINGENNQIVIDIPREISDLSSRDNYLELDFSISHIKLELVINMMMMIIQLVNLGPIAFFSKSRLTSSSGKG